MSSERPFRAAASLLMLGATFFAGTSQAQQHQHTMAPASSSVGERASVRGPDVFENLSRKSGTVEISLVASPAKLTLVPGKATEAYAYNGRVPGRRLEVREGDRVIIHFRNELPDSTTVHWHGLHLPVTADGSPFHPVAPGETRDFEFTIRPGSAGTYWYHP